MRDTAMEPGKGGTAPLPLSEDLDVSEVSDWIALLKPRVMSLVVFTGLIGLLVAPGHIHPTLALTAVFCIAIGAGASGAINMWYDRDIDAVMRRTAARPIPAGRIKPGGAVAFGVTLAVASTLLLGLATNWVAAGILALTIGFYVFVYTMWLKRRTAQNIVIGGAAGALPPVIGWAAVTGGVDVLPLLLFAIVFVWTPPHFWALSLWTHADYARAGVPMLPVVSGARETRRQILLYAVLLAPLGVVPSLVGETGWAYGLAAALLGAEFIRRAIAVWRDAQDEAGVSQSGDRPAKRLFTYSILYLFALFAALAVDRLLLAGA